MSSTEAAPGPALGTEEVTTEELVRELLAVTAEALAVARESQLIALRTQEQLAHFDELLTELEPHLRRYLDNPAAKFLRAVKGGQHGG